jgi:DNA-binding NtrC family response regulator
MLLARPLTSPLCPVSGLVVDKRWLAVWLCREFWTPARGGSAIKVRYDYPSVSSLLEAPRPRLHNPMPRSSRSPARSTPAAGTAANVVVIEDDAALRSSLARAVKGAGLIVGEAETCAAAVRMVEELRPSVVITDLNLPDGDALDLLPKLRRVDENLRIFIITAYGSIDLAVRAVKAGAENFFTKPIDIDSLVTVVRRAAQEREKGSSGARPKVASVPFLSTSPAMQRIEEQVERLRDADCSVLLLGETGTGKSLLAKRLHQIGARAQGPFVDVNCAGLSRDLVESELFGHERGAFTGAQAAKAGLFDAADHGSLFLDEIGDIDLAVQPKILKVLEEKRFRRMGDVRERTVDVRLLAATHHDLLSAIEARGFRADLYYRISTVTITIPALRERPEDILPLSRHLVGDVEIAEDARQVLLSHAWPGNIRELKNVLERALLLRAKETIFANDLQFDTRPSSPSSSFAIASEVSASSESIKELEREHIVKTLIREKGHVEAASRRLGIPRSTLYQKLRTYQIEIANIRKGGAS